MRRVRKPAVFAAVLALVLGSAIVPDLPYFRAEAALAAAPTPAPQIGFLTTPKDKPLKVTASSGYAASIQYKGTETVVDANGVSFQAAHYTFRALTLDDLTISDGSRSTYALTLGSPGTTQLGGTNSTGQQMQTDLWANNLYASSPLLLCALPAAWLLSLGLSLSVHLCDVRMDLYALKAFNPSPTSGRDNPVRLPSASLSVTSKGTS
ncbi:hypothetical protein [Actinokineospora globicatena]|uniref:hypothetical protein n=1 Tax=Actinokineospora globicatena TaxID=103729 RepID=UPI0020A4374E|nr:hypothetical protein [Actinokineospora globicatena]MCP2305538.1 hypothetical protein [Actinokineospora globicatena]GLW81406.1 hypothetical protein Aglo01_58870 [Actinokineospora globicatena]GLW87896.1 hypothetical protein Aglo02_55350 [Actinokineospora globicatena]